MEHYMTKKIIAALKNYYLSVFIFYLLTELPYFCPPYPPKAEHMDH